ncbi:FimV/HubP family polar landmark protein [Psychrobacter sp.]|uniref:FimV/HubP family polar landmark protein n=2 Tax=Psychrobacter sp. TaxID=56811 RepID=UPI003F96131B
MNNLLYIIAGLVVILLVGILLLRKNKAQQSSTRPYARSSSNVSSTSPVSRNEKTLSSSMANENKFDPVSIAQRFMDQQRHDKAIEALNRGLQQKPNDSQMLLKLLSIYGTTDQLDNFKKVHESIKAQNNPESIASANELHSVYFEKSETFTTDDKSTEKQDYAEGLDFGLPTNQSNGSESIHNDDKTQNSDITQDSDNTIATDTSTDSLSLSGDLTAADITVDNNQNDFDLTLSDLESDLENGLNKSTTSTTPVTTLNDHENLSSPTNGDVATVEDTDLSEFDFNFDETEEDNNSSDQTLTSNESDDAQYIEMDIVEDDNDDFMLDFGDLEDGLEDESEDNGFAQEDDNDLTLSLDDLDESDDSGNLYDLESGLNSELQPEEPIVETDSDKKKSSSPLFNDNFLIDDDFDFDAFSENPTSAAPVVSMDPEDTTAESITFEELSERFSADFDFVRSLDNKQVTLDLADQYLQLGEYDSAKRLLKEVMAQGSIDQQRQAKAILNRTA